MKKLLGIVDGNVEKTQLNEGVGECGMGGMGSSMPSTPPVTMSVNLNAQGVDNIKELLNLMRSAESGMGHDHSPAPMGMPMPAVGLDMPIKVTKISGGDGDKPEMNPAGSDGDRGMDQIKDLVRKAGIEKEYSNSPEEAYSDVDSVTTDAGGGWQEPKDPADIRVKDPSGYTQAEEEYANEPDEQYSDHNTMIKDLSGGINREKRQYAKAQDGDNAMAVRESSIRRQLDAMWKEIKEGSQSNPALSAALKKQELGEPLTPQEQRLIRMHTANDLANQQSPNKEARVDEFDIKLMNPGKITIDVPSKEVEAVLKTMKPEDYIEYNNFNKKYPDEKSYGTDRKQYLNVAYGHRKNDEYNFVSRWNRDNNNLTIGQWLEKAKNAVKGAVTGNPSEPVGYRAYRYDQEDPKNNNRLGGSAARDEKNFPSGSLPKMQK